jgi:hypothetical protein
MPSKKEGWEMEPQNYYVKDNEPMGYANESYVENIKNAKLARAYVPYQVWGKVYSPDECLKKGTAFPELYYPNY